MSSADSFGSAVLSRYFPSRFSSAFALRGVDPQQPAGRDPQVAVQAGLRGDDAAQLGALVPAELVRVLDGLFELGDHAGADGGVALGGLGVEADDEPLVLGDPHLLDLEVPRDVLVASLPGQRGGRVGGPGAELLPDDVAAAAFAQVAAVLRGGEAAVGDPDDLRQAPVPHVVLDLPDQRGVARVPGPAPDPHGDPVPGHGHPDDDLGQVVAVVLGLPPGAEPARLSPLPVLAVRLLAGHGVALLIAGDGLVFVLRHEVGGGGVEEQQVDFEVQQVGEVVEDLPLQVVADLQQPVHRPVAGIVAGRGQPGDQDVLAGPPGGGQFRGRRQRPVRDQREQHPLGGVVEAAALEQPAHLLADAEP